jgi:hypothetical protein
MGDDPGLEVRVNDLILRDAAFGRPQDEVYRSEPHGEERREATRLES